MIDIGLTKIALVGVVALVVIGPEKLPTVARMAGSLFGRAQRYINEVKSEVSREIELEELRKMQKDVQEAASDVEQSIAKSMAETEQSLNAAWNDTPVASEAEDSVYTPFDLEGRQPKRRAFVKKSWRTVRRCRPGTSARTAAGCGSFPAPHAWPATVPPAANRRPSFIDAAASALRCGIRVEGGMPVPGATRRTFAFEFHFCRSQ